MAALVFQRWFQVSALLPEPTGAARKKPEEEMSECPYMGHDWQPVYKDGKIVSYYCARNGCNETMGA